MAEELITFASKGEMLAKSKQFWNPGKTQFWIESGVPLVIDRREDYFIYDVEGSGSSTCTSTAAPTTWGTAIPRWRRR